MQINSASQISSPFSYYDDEKFVLFCPSIELIFITHSQLIRQGRIVRLCLQIDNTRTHNRQWQWSGHEIEDRSWFLYQVSAFPCVTAMGWAAHGPGWRADWIYWGEIYVSRITPWLGPGSRVQVPNTGPYPVPGHWNPRGEEAPAQPPPRTAETKEKPAENKHSRHQHRHLQQWSQSSRK